MLPAGGANLLIGLEPLEAVRLARYLNPESIVILNSFPLLPIPVKLGEADYPDLDEMVAMLNRLTSRVFAWDLTGIARESFGHSRAMNAICLGIASRLAELPVSEQNLLSVLEEGGRGQDIECFMFGAELASAACPHEVAS
jgi:indolepyruvate ferredoxin oxidoreductase beta subunit